MLPHKGLCVLGEVDASSSCPIRAQSLTLRVSCDLLRRSGWGVSAPPITPRTHAARVVVPVGRHRSKSRFCEPGPREKIPDVIKTGVWARRGACRFAANRDMVSAAGIDDLAMWLVRLRKPRAEPRRRSRRPLTTRTHSQIRASEGSVKHVEVFPIGSVRNSHHRKTSTPTPRPTRSPRLRPQLR